MLTKDEYILRSLSKIKHKRWELYVISRIIHLLNDPDIEFVCQQLVRREEGKFALTDIFFPQFGIHLEVDESHHDVSTNRNADQDRTRDIIDATNHRIERIQVFVPEKDGKPKCSKSLDVLNVEIDDFVAEIRARKNLDTKSNSFIPWNYETRYSAEPHIARGILSIENNPVFKYQNEALKCLGYKGGHYQRGSWVLTSNKGRMAWFPRLYETEKWNNTLSDDGKTITEINRAGNSGEPDLTSIKEPSKTRIVFARYKNELGHVLYRFLGEFEFQAGAGGDNEAIFKRIRSCIETILPT